MRHLLRSEGGDGKKRFIARLKRTRANTYRAARALMAYRRGEDSEEAMIGAMLEAESFDHQRVTAEFCVSLAKGLSRRSR